MRGMWWVLCLLCLLSCKSGKQMQQNSQMDSLTVSHRTRRATEWNLDSLVSAMHVTFDSLEVICMPDTAQVPAVMKRGIVLKAKRSEVKRSQVRMKENAVEKKVVDSTLAVRKETEQMRSTREPPGMYRHWQLVLVAVVLLMLIWCKSRM